MARPRFNPTAEQKKTVEAMSAYGISEDEVARTMGDHGIDPKTLRKHFRHELDIGATKANSAVAQTAYQMATSGKCPAATMFWLKCRAGWKERPGPEPMSTAPKEEPDATRKCGEVENSTGEIGPGRVPRAP